MLIPDAPSKLYEVFVDLLPEGSPIRASYDGSDLEIMVTGLLHDDFADLLDAFFKAVAGSLGIRFKPQGQTTWKRPEIRKGIECDRCYYLDPAKIAAAIAARGSASNDVSDYPNPDLAIEVDISPPEADRISIYESMSVAEVWIFDGAKLTILRLSEEGRYHLSEISGFLPLKAGQVPRWILGEDLADYEAWVQRIRAWAVRELRLTDRM
jgi:Uma2 family endonuclease